VSALRIDAHQHFWRYDPAELAWIEDSMSRLRRDFLPYDLAPLLRENGIDGCVAVQARSSRAETEFLLALAARHPIVSAVVGWVDLCAPDVDAELERLRENAALAGFRHIAQSEPDDRFLVSPAFTRGIARLARHGFSFDLLIVPRQLPAAIELARAFPAQRFVLDHIAKPEVARGTREPWARDVRALAVLPNVWCKLSGLVTEADWTGWKPDDFRPYLEVILEAFGSARLMIGSDWPVCLLAASYPRALGLVRNFIATLSADEQDAILGGTACAFYGIGVPPAALET
jgi:L-fuconolactonase